MNHNHDIEWVLDAWLTDGPTVAPDRVLDVVADRIERKRQRPAWRLDWRRSTMNTNFKIAAGIAAAAIVAVIGYNLLPGSKTGVGGPAASPIPSATASASPSPSAGVECEDQLPGCEGPLVAGVHHTHQFAPGFSYQTTSTELGAWLNVIDLPAIMKIDQGNPNDPYALLWSDATITDQSVPCSTNPDPTRGRRAADWISFLTGNPALVASQPVSVDFGRGITGQQVQLAVADTWTTTCPNHAAHYVSLLTQSVQGQPSEYGLGSDGRVLWTVVDVGPKTVVIQSYGPFTASQFGTATAPIRQLISTIRFD